MTDLIADQTIRNGIFLIERRRRKKKKKDCYSFLFSDMDSTKSGPHFGGLGIMHGKNHMLFTHTQVFDI